MHAVLASNVAEASPVQFVDVYPCTYPSDGQAGAAHAQALHPRVSLTAVEVT
jgi:hypothetical protein